MRTTLLVHGRSIVMIRPLAAPMLVARFAAIGRFCLSRIGWLVSGVELWRAVARFSTTASIGVLPGVSLPLLSGSGLSVSLESVPVIKRIVSLSITV